MIRLFAHRGFCLENIPQNSIASLKSAYDNKFGAIEFDIWLVNGELLLKLVLKHDQPNSEDNLPNFHDYMRFKNEMVYWLDFKNLHGGNAKEAFDLVKLDIEEAGIDLQRFYFAPFITDYKIAAEVLQKAREVFGERIQFVAVCEEEKMIPDLEKFMRESRVKALSIFHQLLNKNFMKNFSDIEIFAWTINDLKRLKELESIGVKNFATDKITPQIYGEKT